MGRPSVYTPEIATEICNRVAEGESLYRICEDDHMPSRSTVLKWALDDLHGFSSVYARARELQLGVREDEIFDIADDGRNDWEERPGKGGETYIALNKEAVERSKLRVATRQWVLTKLRPDKFGDRVKQEFSGGLTVSDAVDRPPRETREEWTERRKRALGNGSVVGTPARPSNGSDHS